MTATRHPFRLASAYIEAIRNPSKRQYAHAYYQYLRSLRTPQPLPNPDRPAILSYISAQAVRMRRDSLLADRIAEQTNAEEEVTQ